MNMLNSIILEGDIIKAGTLECQFTDAHQITVTIAVERTFRGSKGDTISEVSEFEIIAYGKTAEFLSKKGVEGQGIRVVGRLKQSKWTDSDGKECSKAIVVAEHIEYRPKKSQKKEAEDEK
jgi:single-strand DNA-binding protein